MSMSNIKYRCTGCDFEATLASQAVTLKYQLPSGKILAEGREFGWCTACGCIRSVEPDFLGYLEAEARIAELTQKVLSAKSRVARVLDKMLGGKEPSAEQEELRDLTYGFKIARARNSSPRCLTCGAGGAPGTIPISEYVHACGGHFVKFDDPEAPQFFYKPETIYLDYEGNVVEKFNPTSAYENLAKNINIAGVLEKGMFAGVLIQALFDKEDLLPVIQNTTLFCRFVNVIESRLMAGDFENPIAAFTEGPTSSQMASLEDAPRILMSRTQEPLSKWLRSQVVE